MTKPIHAHDCNATVLDGIVMMLDGHSVDLLKVQEALVRAARHCGDQELASICDSLSMLTGKSAGDFALPEMQSFRVLGAHNNGNLFDIEVEARNGMCAFGEAALLLEEAGADDDTELLAVIPAQVYFGLPGDAVAGLSEVLAPKQAGIYGLEGRSPA